MTYGWLFPDPGINKSVPGSKPKRAKNTRIGKHRDIPQEVIRQIRAEYEALPRPHGLRRVRGGVPKIAAKYGISLSYLCAILYLGIRDEEREPRP